MDLTKARLMGLGSSKNQENSDITSERERRTQMNSPDAGKTLETDTGH